MQIEILTNAIKVSVHTFMHFLKKSTNEYNGNYTMIKSLLVNVLFNAFKCQRQFTY